MTTQAAKFSFPMSYEKAQEIFGQFTQRYPKDTYHSIQDICYHSGGMVTDDNGSEFNFRVDQYTLGNGTKVTRHITGHHHKGYGITDHYWSVTKQD